MENVWIAQEWKTSGAKDTKNEHARIAHQIAR